MIYSSSRNTGRIGLLLLIAVPMFLLLVAAWLYPSESAGGWFVTPWLNRTCGFLSLVGVASLLPVIRNQYRTIRGYMATLPFLFGLLVLTNPNVLNFGPYHVSALSFCGASVCYLRYWTREERVSDLFLALLFLSIGSVTVPYLLWMAVPLLFFHYRHFLQVLAAILLPWLYHFAYAFLIRDQTFVQWGREVLMQLVAVKTEWYSLSVLQIFCLGVLLVTVVLAMVHVFRNERSLIRPSQWNALLAVFYAVLMLGLLVLVFESAFAPSWQLLPLIPTSLIIFDYLHDRFSDYEGRILVILLAGSMLLLRTYQLMS